ncbi:MAG: hypothetical protein SFX72_09935 [Isosphaeraceae bacterium]|nr:hypothetical protein [Isosphaeraceae bacterium]
MFILLGVLLAGQVELQESTPGLRDTLAAALATNEAAASRGSGTFDLLHKYDLMSKTAEANVRLKWANDDFEIAVKLNDPEGYLFGDGPARPISEQKEPAFVLLFGDLYTYCFIADQKIVRVYDRLKAMDNHQMLNVSPRMSWFMFHGPDFGSGTPWIDLVDMTRIPAINSVSGKLDREGDRVRFLRSDAFSTLKIDFSAADDLNVVGFSHRGMRGRPGSENREGSFHWKKAANGRSYLSDLTVTRFVGASDKKDSEYRLTTREFSLEPPAEDYFTERSFFARLPDNVVVIDHTKLAVNRQTLINKKAPSSKAVDKSSPDATRSGSLLNKKP